MRGLIDTNVLSSAALNANGIPFQAYVKAVSYPNHGLICLVRQILKLISSHNKNYLFLKTIAVSLLSELLL